jgi:hypothetical protein
LSFEMASKESGLSYGLNTTKKTSAARAPPAKRKPIFDAEDDSDNDAVGEDVAQEIGELGGLQAPKKGFTKPIPDYGTKKPLGPPKKATVTVYGDLSTRHSTNKHTEAAKELDPSIYDYDAVYDSMKPQKSSKVSNDRRPRYMENLLAAAETRKRDQLRAKEKMLQKEREAEGDEFADKEKFVTGAYKAQLEENRRLEEEERLKEEREAEKRKAMGGGMTGFYRSVLERDEQKLEEAVKAAEQRAKNGPGGADEEAAAAMKSDAEIARELNARKAGSVMVNDEGQVVDKRQLLKGGLNVVPKPKSTFGSAKTNADKASSYNSGGKPGWVAPGGKQAMRERQSRMIEAQLEQAAKRAAEDDEEERQKIERAAKSRKTDVEIEGARERYLRRKREADAKKGEKQDV